MAIRRLLLVASALLANEPGCTVYADKIVESTYADILTSDLLAWLRANGAYINEKLVARRVDPDDPSSPNGIFATDAMAEGETVCKIPSNLIVKSTPETMLGRDPDLTYCGTIKSLMEVMTVDGPDGTPYGKYLLAQPRGYLPPYWSKGGKQLLTTMLKSTRTQQLTEWDELPPHGIIDQVEELVEECTDVDLDDSLYMHAAMLVQARADYEYMVPFYDMMNHNNGKTNVRHKEDTYRGNTDEKGYEIVTSKPVDKGGELFNSYNRCTICYEYYDWFGTPEMFMNFGFVEKIPQRWLFDFARVKFDLEWKDGNETSGEVVVNFLVPPSKTGIKLLKEELTRLKSFSAAHRSNSLEIYEGVSVYEWEALWQYHNALRDAVSHAIQSDVTLTEEVWKLNDNWWVKDGTLRNGTDDSEHRVYPIVNYPECDGSDGCNNLDTRTSSEEL